MRYHHDEVRISLQDRREDLRVLVDDFLDARHVRRDVVGSRRIHLEGDFFKFENELPVARLYILRCWWFRLGRMIVTWSVVLFWVAERDRYIEVGLLLAVVLSAGAAVVGAAALVVVVVVLLPLLK